MKVFPSSSIRKRILIAFSLATLPLAFGLAIAILSIHKLGVQGQTAILNAADTVQYSRTLLQELPDMERNALQYRVLGDPALYKLYAQRHHEFQQTAANFNRLNLDSAMSNELNELSTREQVVFDNFSQSDPNSDKSQLALQQFNGLTDLARSILAQGTQSIDTEVNNMRSASLQRQRQLVWLAAVLVAAVFLMAAISILLITRPLRALDHAIRKLGAGQLHEAVSVRGPEDIRELGRRLDWLRTRLLDLEEHRMQFLRHISHELKTPLTNIREGTQLMTDQIVGPLNAEQLEVVQILNNNGKQLQKRIEDLLAYSALQEPQPPQADQPVKLDQVVQDVVEAQKIAIRAKQLQVDLQLHAVTIMADTAKIHSVVDNLLSNAVKYSPSGGVIRLQLNVKNGQAELDVQDEGPGIRPEEKDRVFDAFYQGQAVNTGYVKGTGLGLAIAREYLRIHHGLIEIIEQKKGAHFRVALPATRAGA